MSEKMIEHLEKQVKQALLVSVFKGGPVQRVLCEEHLQELALLAETYGVGIVEKVVCPVRKFEAATYVTTGKLQELLETAKEQYERSQDPEEELVAS